MTWFSVNLWPFMSVAPPSSSFSQDNAPLFLFWEYSFYSMAQRRILVNKVLHLPADICSSFPSWTLTEALTTSLLRNISPKRSQYWNILWGKDFPKGWYVAWNGLSQVIVVASSKISCWPTWTKLGFAMFPHQQEHSEPDSPKILHMGAAQKFLVTEAFSSVLNY